MEENMHSSPAVRRRARFLPLAAAATLLIALSGCAVGFTPDGPPPGTAPSDAPETPSAPAAADDDPYLSRGAYQADVTKQLTCGGGSLEITDVGMVVEVVDACGDLTVSGDASVVLAREVDRLTVDATGTVTIVATVEEVVVTDRGDAATVLWESGSPTVDDRSVGSVLLSAGATR